MLAVTSAPEQARDDLPISGEWLAIGVAIRAHCQAIPSGQRKAFLRATDAMFDALEAGVAATPIRRSPRGLARLEATKEAVAWYRAARPFVLA